MVSQEQQELSALRAKYRELEAKYAASLGELVRVKALTIVAAVQVICGERTEWLPEIEEWSFPEKADFSLDPSDREAVRFLIEWLDRNARGPIA